MQSSLSPGARHEADSPRESDSDPVPPATAAGSTPGMFPDPLHGGIAGGSDPLGSSTPTPTPTAVVPPPLGSSTLAPSAVSAPNSAVVPAAPASSAASNSRPVTRLQHGIRKPKTYTDGTIRYGHLATVSEPNTLDVALCDPNWKAEMDVEYDALLKNKTWHLVPPQ